MLTAPRAPCGARCARRAARPPSAAPLGAPLLLRGCRAPFAAAAPGEGAIASVTTDEAVPEGHRALHSTLYSDDAAAVHGAAAAYHPVAGEDDGEGLVAVDAYVAARDGAKPPGVFAIYNAARELQYVSFSRNIVLSIKTLRARLGEQRVAHVRALVVANQAMQSRSALSKHAQAWIDAAPSPPPGNGAEAELWGGGGSESGASVDIAAMSPAELAEYEERKLKMRKAMGEGRRDEEEEGPVDAAERRLKMISAMEGGDWSAVIDQQTAATLPPGAGRPVPAVAAGNVEGGASVGASGPASSPFSQAGVHRKIGEGGSGGSVMSIESVTAALEEVRPYLQADGGDVEIVGVEDGYVSLRLEGACSTCASSSATLKMGIERALRGAFGDELKGLIQVDKGVGGASVAAIDAHLNVVRPAIMSMGGAVEVVAVEGGKATLRYKGPPPLAKGLVAAVQEQFKDVREVEVLPW